MLDSGGMTSMAAARSLPSPKLRWWLAAFVFAIFLFNIATIERFPLVWQDEVMFTEPAANWARDGVFFSRAWFFSPESQIWAGNAPLYSMMLTPWLKLFGVSPPAARSFGLLLGTLGIAAWSAAMHRAGLLKAGAQSFFYLAVLFLAYGVATNLRSGRYDGLGILVFGLLALALTAAPGRKRTAALLALGMLIPASGIHLVVPFLAGSLAALAIYGRKAITSIVAIGCGIAAGLAVMLLAFWDAGVLASFLYSTGKLSKIGGGAFPKDPSLFLILLAAGINLIFQYPSGARDRQLAFVTLSTVLVALAFPVLGRFPTYYSWIAIFPLAAVALFRRGESENPVSRIVGVAVLVLLLLAMAVGLPLQIGASLLGPSRDYGQVERLVAAQLRPGDVALVSPAAWYAAWPIAAKTYTTEYDVERKFMTPAQERSVSVLVIDPDLLPFLKERHGGDWHQVAMLENPQQQIPLLSGKFGQKLFWQYRIAIYRRD